jgi:hypothetical protein
MWCSVGSSHRGVAWPLADRGAREEGNQRQSGTGSGHPGTCEEGSDRRRKSRQGRHQAKSDEGRRRVQQERASSARALSDEIQFDAERAGGTGSKGRGVKVQMMLDVWTFLFEMLKAMGCCCWIPIQGGEIKFP